MSIRLIPYIEIDGIPTFPDSEIMGLFDRVVDDGFADIVFYEGTITTHAAFLRAMKSAGNHLYIAQEDGDVAGAVWLNRFESRSAHLHFCLFQRDSKVSRLKTGKEIVKRLIGMHGKNGFFYDLFIGRIPCWNTMAIEFAVRCGAEVVGVVPNAVFNARLGKSEPATFIYFTRECVQ